MKYYNNVADYIRYRFSIPLSNNEINFMLNYIIVSNTALTYLTKFIDFYDDISDINGRGITQLRVSAYMTAIHRWYVDSQGNLNLNNFCALLGQLFAYYLQLYQA